MSPRAAAPTGSVCHHVLLPQAEVCVATCCYAQTGYECVSPAAIYTFGSSEKLLCYTPCCTHGYKMHVNNLITGAVLLEELELCNTVWKSQLSVEQNLNNKSNQFNIFNILNATKQK